MEIKKAKLSKVIFIAITTVVAILIISFTAGKEIYEGKGQSLTSFGLVHFSGYLFFLLMPVEMAFIYYLSFYQKIAVIVVALGTAMAAQIIDYLIGYSLSSKFLCKIVGEKRVEKAEKQIKKFGNITIFLFNVLPLSSPIIAAVAGMLKYKFKDLMLYSFVGLGIKYILLSLIF